MEGYPKGLLLLAAPPDLLGGGGKLHFRGPAATATLIALLLSHGAAQAAPGAVKATISPATSISAPAPAPAPNRASNLRTNALRVPLVVLDPGHGGHDPGAISVRARQEKAATLALALAIRDRLTRSGKVRVALTRSDDRFIGLFERRQYARKVRADLFLSIHADSAASAAASGPTVYTLSLDEAGRVATRLNARSDKSDLIAGANLNGAGSDSASILLDMAQGLTRSASSSFASVLKRHVRDAEIARPFHLSAAFAVLKAPDMPSALLETGYLSNPDDEARLFSPDGRATLAQQVAAGIESYFFGTAAAPVPAVAAVSPAPRPRVGQAVAGARVEGPNTPRARLQLSLSAD